MIFDIYQKVVDIRDKPFSCTIIDYFGPYQVKMIKRTVNNTLSAQRYEVFFIWMTKRTFRIE